MVDFKKRLAGKKAEKPVDPVKLYDTLDRAHDKGHCRWSKRGRCTIENPQAVSLAPTMPAKPSFCSPLRRNAFFGAVDTWVAHRAHVVRGSVSSARRARALD
ncbi:MAG TPA: hypothetical protein VN901_09010 [Candidatus Acidoferrales bacterium]|nr:hypothetical protein [Candidatus Acidoferrales bacterium]